MYPRYLDPRNNIVFKHIFGENKDLLMDLLNALLPIPNPIVELEYLPAQLVPDIPDFKDTVVDIRCKDAAGRQFIVEMQMNWTTFFRQRVLFNGCKAYVRQLEKGENYNMLKPVYALSIINDIYEKTTTEYYHHYKIVDIANNSQSIHGLELIFIELPKFTPKAMPTAQDLWLRFFREINEKTESAPPELLARPAIKKAVELTKEAALTPSQLERYDQYWGLFSQERSLIENLHETIKDLTESQNQLQAAEELNLRLAAEIAQAEAEKAQAEAEKAQAEAEKAQAEAEKAQAEAEKAQAEAEKTQAEAEKTQAEAKLQEEKQKQLAGLKQMQAAGLTIDQMAAFSAISAEEIRQLLD